MLWSMQIDVYVYDGWDELDAIAPYEVLAGVEAFDVRLVTLDGPRDVTAAHGLVVRALAARPAPALVVVPGGGWSDHDRPGAWAEVQRGELAAAVAAHHARGAVVASVCTGAHIAAAAGLLAGRRATTHHGSYDDLEAAGAIVDRGARVVDLGDVATSGGITSGLHLAMHLVERFAGADERRARDTEMEFTHIPGGAPTMSPGTSRREGTEMSERTGVRADDPYGGRQPTSHERREGQPLDASYLDGPAPWDVGRPQPAVLRLAGEGAFAGAVLDAGCGTGENALHVASLGLPVLGVDVAETALSIAREKAAGRGLDVDFVVADALHLDRLGQVFDTVLDCGLFHMLDRDERRDYVAGLASVTSRGGSLYVLCFGDVGPDTGPHPVSQEELRAAFTPSGGWSVASVSPDRLQARFAPQGVPAWLAKIDRI